MRIEHFDGSGDNAAKIGEEVFEFNIDAGMALSKTTDFSGNATEYEYADELPASDPRRQLGYAARFSERRSTSRRRSVSAAPSRFPPMRATGSRRCAS